MLLGLTQHSVAGVQDILGVVQLARDGVLDVVEKFQDIAPRHHAARGHGHSACLFHDRAELVQRLKYSVHGNILQA